MKNKYLNITYKLVSLILIICFVFTLIKDYLVLYEFGSAPFYVYVLKRGIEFILPIVALTIIKSFIRR